MYIIRVSINHTEEQKMYPNITNWSPFVNKLLETHSQVDLEKKTGIKQSSISSISAGDARTNLSYPRAIALLKLMTKKQIAEIMASTEQ